MKKVFIIVLSMVSLVLLLPGLMMVFLNHSEWNSAKIILTALLTLSAALSLISMLLAIQGKKQTRALLFYAGSGAVLSLILLIYLTMSLELTVITTAGSAVLMFINSRVLSQGKNE